MNDTYEPHEIRLAQEIAETLNDRDSLTLHLQYARKYKEEHLRKKLNKVMSLPDNKIKKSRAALYTYLVSRGEDYESARY